MPRHNSFGEPKADRPRKSVNVFDSPEAQVKEGYGSIDWTQASAGSLQRAIATITNKGGALLLARTSDGGALSLTLFYGDDKKKVYIAPGDEPDEVLDFWNGFFDTLS
jgi:hypothetical protein